MGGRWTLFIFLAIVGWQVVAAIAGAMAKKREEERRREMSSRQPQSVPRTQQPVRTKSRAQTLAERRQAQLEELRGRRQQRSTSTPAPTSTSPSTSTPAPVDLRTGPVTVGPTVPQPSGRGTMRVPTLSRPTGPAPVAVPTRRSRTAPAPTPTAPAPTPSRMERWQERQRQAEQRRAEAQRRLRQRPPELQPPPKPVRRGTATLVESAPQELDPYRHRTREGAVQIKGRLSSRTSLREVFVLKELLDPPLAMRPPESGAG